MEMYIDVSTCKCAMTWDGSVHATALPSTKQTRFVWTAHFHVRSATKYRTSRCSQEHYESLFHSCKTCTPSMMWRCYWVLPQHLIISQWP